MMALSVLLVDGKRDRTQAQIADKLGVSQSNVHRALQQLEKSGLVRDKQPIRGAALEFFVHALKYVYPVQLLPAGLFDVFPDGVFDGHQRGRRGSARA